MAIIYFLCVGLFCLTQAQYIPIPPAPCSQASPCQQLVSPLLSPISPCQQVIPPCQTPVSSCQTMVSPCQTPVSPCQSVVSSPAPVVATTIVDNSVSNALANALQLLIVSNLIENTMNAPCGCGLSGGLIGGLPLGDCGPSIYPSPIEILAPPCLPYDPMPACEIIAPCEPVIEIIPNSCYPEILPIPNPGCGCGCDVPFMSNIGPNFGSNFASNCGCRNGLPSLESLLPGLLPNLGCGCKKPFGQMCGCGCDGPILPDVYPGYNNYGCGMPGCVESYNYDPYPNRCYGNGPYYY